MSSAKGFWPCGTVFRRPARAQLAALPTQTPRRSGIRRRGRRAIRRACGSAPYVLSEDPSRRRSIQATRLAVGGAGRSKWRYDVGVHAISPAIGGAQTGRTSRSASRAPRPVSAPVGARRCLPRGAGSRWVAAEPRPRRRGSRRILALPTDPRAVVPVESRARRPELPRRRLVLAPRGGSGSAARAWLRLDLVGGLATITPTHPVSSRRCPPHPCPPRPAACRCHTADAHWLPRPRSAAGLSSPPAPLAVSGRRSPAWLRLVACRPPHPPLCRPPAARPIHVHPIRLRAPAVPLLPAGSLPPPGARRPSHCRRTLRRCLRPAGRLFTPAGTLMLAGSLFPLGEEARNLPGGCSFLPLPGGSLAPPSPPPPRPTAPVRLRLPAGPTAARGLPPCLRIPSSCSPLLSCCVPAGSSVRLSRRPVRLPLRAPRAVCVWRILASGT